MKFSIVDYSPKYKKDVIDLFKKTFQRNLSNEFWKWRFEKNPWGNPIMKLALFEKKIIGNYLVHPLKIVNGKETIPILYSMTTMTDPEFWGKGITTTLANHVYDIGKERGFKAVIGFANKNSHDVFIKKLGFIELHRMKELIVNNSQITSKLRINEISNFNEIPTNFCSNIINSFGKFTVKRDNNFLNWRFKSNPENKYYCYKILNNNEFCGYFVLKKFQEVKCHIIDFLLKDEIDCYNSMLNFSKIFSKKFNLNTITLWTNNKNILNVLNHKSCDVIPQETYFILKILNETNNNLKNYKNWHITMSDSDVF